MSNELEYFGVDAIEDLCKLVDELGIKHYKGLCIIERRGPKAVLVNNRYYSVDLSKYPLLNKCNKIIVPACILKYNPYDVSLLVRLTAIKSASNPDNYDKLCLVVGEFAEFDAELAAVCRLRNQEDTSEPISYNLYKFIVNTHHFERGDYMLVCDYTKDKVEVYVKNKYNNILVIEDTGYAMGIKRSIERQIERTIAHIFIMYHGDLRRTRMQPVGDEVDIIVG